MSEKSTSTGKTVSLRFFTPFLGGALKAIYAIHLRHIRIMEFLLVIELVLVGVAAEALRTNIDFKLPFLNRLGQFGSKF